VLEFEPDLIYNKTSIPWVKLSGRSVTARSGIDLTLLYFEFGPKSASTTMWCSFAIDTRSDFSYDGPRSKI